MLLLLLIFTLDDFAMLVYACLMLDEPAISPFSPIITVFRCRHTTLLYADDVFTLFFARDYFLAQALPPADAADDAATPLVFLYLSPYAHAACLIDA